MFHLLYSISDPKKYYKYDEFFYINNKHQDIFFSPQFLDLTFQFCCRINFQESSMILQCKHAEYDKSFLGPRN